MRPFDDIARRTKAIIRKCLVPVRAIFTVALLLNMGTHVVLADAARMTRPESRGPLCRRQQRIRTYLSRAEHYLEIGRLDRARSYAERAGRIEEGDEQASRFLEQVDRYQASSPPAAGTVGRDKEPSDQHDAHWSDLAYYATGSGAVLQTGPTARPGPDPGNEPILTEQDIKSWSNLTERQQQRIRTYLARAEHYNGTDRSDRARSYAQRAIRAAEQARTASPLAQLSDRDRTSETEQLAAEGSPAKEGAARSLGDARIRCRFSGRLLNRAYYGISNSSSVRDSLSASSWLTLESDLSFNEPDLRFFAAGDVRYDLTTNRRRTINEFDISLGESYMELNRPNWRLRAGRQLFTWGKLDEFGILDIVNPQDYTEGILLEKQDRKEPLLALELSYFWSQNSLEAFFALGFEPDEMDFFGSNWALFGHLKDEIRQGAFPQNVKQVVDNIRIERKDRSYRLSDSEAGLRFVGRTQLVDYGLYYLYLNQRAPVLAENTPTGRTLKAFLFDPTEANLNRLMSETPSQEDLVLRSKHSRMHVVGLDLETTLGNYGLRGEAGLFLRPFYMRDDFSLVKKDTIMLGMGIDRTIPSTNTYWNLQFIERIILDHEPLFLNRQFEHQILGRLEQGFLRGRLLITFHGGYDFTHRDSFLNPEITYELAEALNLSLGGFFFYGNPRSVMGRFRDNDCIYILVVHDF